MLTKESKLKNWRDYYNTFPLQISDTDYLRQVGKTVCGKIISNYQFNLIINSIVDTLQINSNDNVLDLCCGNGLVTKEIAKYCRNIVGVDYSKPLIDIANSVHLQPNCNYVHQSILELKSSDFDSKFTKVYMYEALQHFKPKQLYNILEIIRKISTTEVQILFGSVPNKKNLWQFYNSPSRKFDYYKRKLLNKEAIGMWWSNNIIEKISRLYNFDCFFKDQNEDLYTAHYRFDVLVTETGIKSV